MVRVQPCPVVVGGVTYTVAAVDAGGWLVALTSDLHDSVVPGLLLAEDRLAVVRRLMVGGVESDALWAAARDVIEVVSGHRWWQALYLVGYAEQGHGALYGRLLLAGVRPEGITFAAWCAAMFAMITRDMDEAQRTRFDASFLMPPDGDVSQVEDWDTGIPAGWS
jgi:hypothetical protein